MNDKNNHFTLTTVPRKKFLLLGVLTLWLALWGGGLLVVAAALLRGEVKEAGFFVIFILLAWLAVWLLGGGLAFYGLLWTVCGTETLVATAEQITITRRICGSPRVRHYDAARIRNLRMVEANGATDFFLSLRLFGIGNGLLAFDYGATVVTFVEGGDRAPAPELLAKLHAILLVREEESRV
jgi:hypothetical protein